MSGIAGIFHLRTVKPVDPARLRAMLDAQLHRGPDGADLWTSSGVGLGHRRMGALDGDGGNQPSVAMDGSLVASLDGNLCNSTELRAELKSKGFQFRTSSDAEVILIAWREWGEGCLARIQGEFAFALYDRTSDALFLVRDRLGVRPLHYAEISDGSLIFASELKGLLAHPLLRRAPDPQAIEDYLTLGYVPDRSCLVTGVKKLPAGHCLRLKRGSGPRTGCWWDVDFATVSGTSAPALEEEMISILREAVRSRMSAGASVGAFLSGDVGTSAVVALMAEASRRAIETCSTGLDGADPGEPERSELVARRFATRHRSRVVAAGDLGFMRMIANALDEPFADPSALADYSSCELARQRMAVALSGDGSDPLFIAGPHNHMLGGREGMRRLLPDAMSAVMGIGGRLLPPVGRMRETLQALRFSIDEAHAANAVATPAHVRKLLYRPSFTHALQGHRGEQIYIDAMRAAPAEDLLSRAQYADLKIRLPADILARIDRASMAVGLEVRHPWLDHLLVEFAARLPTQLRLRRGTGKSLLRRALRRYLPDEILAHRPVGARLPGESWLDAILGDRAAPAAKGTALAELGWFDSAAAARIATEYRSGKAEHGLLLWQLVVLETALQRLFALGNSSGYNASMKYSPSGGALNPSAARERA